MPLHSSSVLLLHFSLVLRILRRTFAVVFLFPESLVSLLYLSSESLRVEIGPVVWNFDDVFVSSRM
jgi:hypothetical protein